MVSKQKKGQQTKKAKNKILKKLALAATALLSLSASMCTVAYAETLSRPQDGDGANLIQNEAFVRDDFGIVRAWMLRSSEDVAEPLEGRGPDGSTALRLDLSKGRQYYQTGLKLVPDEPYRLSPYVRSKGHKNGYGFKVQYRREVPAGYGGKLVKLTRSAKGPDYVFDEPHP